MNSKWDDSFLPDVSDEVDPPGMGILTSPPGGPCARIWNTYREGGDISRCNLAVGWLLDPATPSPNTVDTRQSPGDIRRSADSLPLSPFFP